MKKTILLSLVAAGVLFTACDEKAKDSVAEAASSVTSSVKEAASSAVDKAGEVAGDLKEKAAEKVSEVADAAKEKAAEAVEATKEAATNAVEKVAEAKDAATEKVSEVAESAQDSVASAAQSAGGNEAGKAAYAKCAGCHGVDGKTQALGKSAVVAGQSAEDLEKALHEYKAGTRNVAGMGMLMKGQVASMSDEDIKAVSEYMSAM